MTITSEHTIFTNREETQAICKEFFKASNIDFLIMQEFILVIQ